MTLSIFFLILSVMFFYEVSSGPKNRLLFAALLAASLSFSVLFAVAHYLSGNGIDNAVIYHLRYGLKGAGLLDFWKLIAVAAVAVAVSCYLSYIVSFSKKDCRARGTPFIFVAYLFIVLSIFFSPTSKAFLGAYYGNFNLPDREKALMEFARYYVSPTIEKIAPNKNLVFIYTEGVEQTHLDETLFPGLTPGLSALQRESVYFSDVTSTVGTGFTIGGIIAGHCGIPLIAPSHLNAFGSSDKYLPNIICLGDLLNKKGYYLSYFGGADLEFAGKGKFLNTHGFHETFGKNNLRQKVADPKYLSWWGLYDDTTLDFAFARFKELSRMGQNFALFTLTIDAHHPRGNPSKTCEGMPYGDGKLEILNAVHCTDKLVSDFVQKIKDSPYAEDTVIVVASDHLALQNPATPILKKSSSGRSNLFMVLNSGMAPERVDNPGSTLDVGSTVLSFIGFEGEIGLGRNLMSEHYSAESAEYVRGRLEYWTPAYMQFWDFPQMTDQLRIRGSGEAIEDYSVLVDDRRFGAPIMIEFNYKLETNIVFKYQDDLMIHIDEKYSIFQDRVGTEEARGQVYLAVDRCSELAEIDPRLPTTGICYIIGKDKIVFQGGNASSAPKLGVDDLLKLF